MKTELNNINLSKDRNNEIVVTGGMFSQTMQDIGDIVRSFFHAWIPLPNFLDRRIPWWKCTPFEVRLVPMFLLQSFIWTVFEPKYHDGNTNQYKQMQYLKFESIRSLHWRFKTIFVESVKVQLFWKGTKIWKNLPLVLTLLSKNSWEIFSNFVAFS